MEGIDSDLILSDGYRCVASVTCWTFGKHQCASLPWNAVLYRLGCRPPQTWLTTFQMMREAAISHYIERCCP